MKKIVGIILCLAAVCGAGVYFYTQQNAGPAGQYARYLPQDVLATANLTHINTLTDRFPATAAGHLADKETIHAVLQEMRAGEQAIARYDAMYDNIAKVMTNPAFRAVFGEDATVALLPPDRQVFAKDPLEAFRQSMVVLAETEVSGALDMFTGLISGKTVAKETVDGLELTRITLEPDQVIYGYADKKIVLLAYTPAVIKTCLATRKTETSLEQAPGFTQARAFWQPYPAEKTYSRVYMNNAAIAPLLLASENADIKQGGAYLQGIDYGYSVTFATAQGVENRARSTYHYDQLHPMIKNAVDSVSKSNQSLHLLKANSLAYNWSSSLQPEMILKTLAADSGDLESADATIRESFGVSLKDLAAAVGPQYGGVLDEIVNAGLFPIPKMVLFLGIRDRKIVDKALDRLRKKIAEYGIAGEEEERVGNSTIYSWPVLPGDAAQPAVVVTDSMLYLANNKQMLKEALTANTAADTLAEPVKAQLGPQLSERFQRANVGSFVMYPERMSAQVGDLMDWVTGILSTSKNLSLSRLSREIVQLMKSTEFITVTTDISKEKGDWSMVVKPVSPPSGKTAQ